MAEVAIEEMGHLRQGMPSTNEMAAPPPGTGKLDIANPGPRLRGGPRLSDLLPKLEPDAEAETEGAPTAGETAAETELGLTLPVAAAEPPPWERAGGFSFAKVLMGERLRQRASSPQVPKEEASDNTEAVTSLRAILGIAGSSGEAKAAALSSAAKPQEPFPSALLGGEARLVAVRAELNQLSNTPLTTASFEGLEERERDELLGDRLYSLIELIEPQRTGQITVRLPPEYWHHSAPFGVTHAHTCSHWLRSTAPSGAIIFACRECFLN